MGNSRKEKENNKINIILSGGSFRPKIVEQDSLTIKLVEIDPIVLEKVGEQKAVKIIKQNDSYYCHHKGEVLGKIPSNYNYQVQSLNKSNAMITSIWRTPPIVTIKI